MGHAVVKSFHVLLAFAALLALPAHAIIARRLESWRTKIADAGIQPE